MKNIILFLIILSVVSVMSVFSAGASEAAPEGAYLRYTVDVNKPEDVDLAFNFMTIKRGIDYIIQEGDMLEYDVFSYIDEGGWGAIDGEIAGIGTIRDSGIRDVNGVGIHTGNNLSGHIFQQWHRRQIYLGVTEEDGFENNTVGRALRQIQVAMHPTSVDSTYTGVVLYDNIVITNNGEIQYVIFRDEGDLDPADFRASGSQHASATLELLVFTAEEIQAFADEAEERAREEEERRIARETAAAEAAAERERERESREAAEAAESDPIDEAAPAQAAAAGGDDDDGLSLWLIILIIAGGVGAAIAVIIAVVADKKKKQS